MKIGTVSLGCDKNRVDTEKMLSRLSEAGHVLVGSEEEADVIIVNTCAFIDSAKAESIDEILNASAAKCKDESKSKKIIVTGCLAQRYIDTLEKEFPEIDAILGVADYDEIASVVEKICEGDKIYNTSGADGFYPKRVLTTPYHYAYLKIADGCDNKCTYCAIPSIRGSYRSEKPEDLLKEAERLSGEGVKELILVAQDVTRYGTDFDGKPHLIELVRELAKLDFSLIRLMYLEPEMVTDELIDFIACEPKIAKYVDIPLQHVDGGMLRKMNRRIDETRIRELIRKVKDRGIAMRTSFICGFPAESEEAFQKLKEFVREEKLDYAGFFEYSREEGTPADRMKGHLPDEVKSARARELYGIQTKVMCERNKEMLGSVVKVIYEDIDYDRQTFVGRTEFQAPDIDNVIYFEADQPLDIGCFYDVLITDTDGVDLIGRVVK